MYESHHFAIPNRTLKPETPIRYRIGAPGGPRQRTTDPILQQHSHLRLCYATETWSALEWKTVYFGPETGPFCGMPMSLNNNVDEITLFDGASQERDRFRYEGSTEGAEIVPSH